MTICETKLMSAFVVGFKRRRDDPWEMGIAVETAPNVIIVDKSGGIVTTVTRFYRAPEEGAFHFEHH